VYLVNGDDEVEVSFCASSVCAHVTATTRLIIENFISDEDSKSFSNDHSTDACRKMTGNGKRKDDRRGPYGI